MKNTFERIALLVAVVATVAWLRSPILGASQASHGLPIVVMMVPPTYPMIARLPHLQGVVHLRVTTDGRQVITAETEGKAPQLLAVSAAKNVRSWQFEPGDPTTFEVTYAYKLVTRHIPGADATSVTLELPTRVEISANVPVNVDLAPDTPGR